MNSELSTQHSQSDVIVIGSGIGGLCAAGLLARYGKRVIVRESHAIPGGAAHSFRRRGFEFDSGPSFYCGLTDAQSLNPVTQVLKVLGESVHNLLTFANKLKSSCFILAVSALTSPQADTA